MTQHDPVATLRQMLEYAETALRIAGDHSNSELLDDEVSWHASARVVEIVGEAASRLDRSQRPEHHDIPWAQIVGTRNFLVHAYDQIDPEVMLRIVREDIPKLTEALRTILSEMDP